MKQLTILLVLTLLVIYIFAQEAKKETPKSTNDATLIGKLEYPHNFIYQGNPVSRMHSAADPDVHVWDDVVWVYCSQDRKKDTTIHKKIYDSMDGYHVFSTPDLINWTDHGEIFHSSDVSWKWKNGGFLAAPGAIRKNGKYYLYFPIKDKNGIMSVGVAVGDTPIGPFKEIGHPLEGLIGIDPKVFIDDDGQAYIYNNPGVVAKLKPNMIELAEKSHTIDYAPIDILNDDSVKFKEGIYMHKKDSLYYFSYSNYKNKNYQAFYAIGKTPYGPFEWKGALASAPKGAQDHHSIIEFKGQWYYFYHISIKGLPKYKEGHGRIFCYEKLYYNADGTIQMVKHTR